jgi:hypothetical protein
MSSLRFFGLTDEAGHPTPQLTRLVTTEGEENKKVLRELLQTFYPFLFGDGFNLKTATSSQLRERFKEFNLGGDTVIRCIAFFMAAARDAGIELSTYLTKTRGTRSANSSGRPKRKTVETKPRKTKQAGKSSPPQGITRIPIPISSEKIWHIEIDTKHSAEEINNFLSVIKLILGAKS